MRAIRIEEQGGPDRIIVAESPDPEPGAGELVVRVGAAGINYIDVYQRDGTYQIPLPYTLGLEGAGTVEAVGDGVTEFAEGDTVAWCAAPGSYAERVVVPAEKAVAVPDTVGARTAAAAMLQGLTTHYLITSTYAVQPGDAVLVHAAAGGVGLLLVQWATARGARVIATASTPDKRELALRAGAETAVGYDGFADAVREFTGGAGVAAVYDGVGRATFEGSLESVGVRGTLALFGAASGQVPPFDPQRLNPAGSVFLTRPTLVHYTRTREELTERSAELFDAIGSGALDIRIGGEYPLADAARAHTDLESRATTGKLLLLP